MISLIKKQDYSKENQKQLSKAILTKKTITIHLDYCLSSDNKYNELRTGKSIMFIYYAVTIEGVEFLKNTLKKLLQFKNIRFNNLTKQDIYDYLELDNECILQDIRKLYNLNY